VSGDVDRLDVPRVVPNRASRRHARVDDRPLPSADDGAMAGYLVRTRVRAIARSRVVSAALAELQARAEVDGGEADG
jgi:hypothetical protein